jgi:RNA polymerase-associated protein RTF1
MDESDSDSDGRANFDDADRFPLEGKFMNAADKADIMAMPEIKREELLAERAQQVERDRQNRALRQLLNARDAGNKSKKRKAGAADLEETNRKTSRQRTKVGGGKVGEASSGIDSLKRARAEKDDRQRRRQEDRDRNADRRGGRDYSDVDASGESDVEWDTSKPKRASHSPVPRDAPLAELRDVERVRVGRTQFALVCFYPGFNEAITGCFVRISVGASKETGENLYRMAIIKGRSAIPSTRMSNTDASQVSLKADRMRWRQPMVRASSLLNMSLQRMANSRKIGL